jgi:hypothetical protein
MSRRAWATAATRGGVQAQAVLKALRHVVFSATGEVELVGGDDLVGGCVERVGEGAQRGILVCA